MSDSPEHPNPPVPTPEEPVSPETPEAVPTSEAPNGLAPSPGIAPPVGLSAPEVSTPVYEAPQYEAPTFDAPSFEAPSFEAPQYQAPATTVPPVPAPEGSVPPVPAPQDPAPQDPAAGQYQPAAEQFPQQPVQPIDQPQFAAPQSDQQDPAPMYAQDPGPQYGQDLSQQQFVPMNAGNDAQFAQGAPYAAGMPGGPAGPGGPNDFGGPAGPGGPDGPKKGLSTGALIGIIGGGIALVVLLIIGGVMATGWMSGSGSSSEATSSGEGKSGGGKTEKNSKKPQSAGEAVELFLNSVAEGDASTARKLAGGSSSDELLTEEALAASLKVAPITNIVIEEDDSDADDFESTVTASFNIGDTSVTRDFKVWNSSNTFEIWDALTSLSFYALDGLEPKVNGIEVSSSSSLKAFPGAYQVTLGIEHFELDSKSDTIVIGDRNDASAASDLQSKLTDAAADEYRSLVAASLQLCLQSKTYTTDCGLEVSKELSGGEKVIDGTIIRTLDTEAEAKLKRLKPESSYSAPTVVSTYDYISVDTKAEVEKDGVRSEGALYGGGLMLKPTVDFSEDKLTVNWE